MNKRDKAAFQFGALLENGHRQLDNRESPSPQLQQNMMQATMQRPPETGRGQQWAVGLVAAVSTAVAGVIAATIALSLVMNQPTPITFVLDGKEHITGEGQMIRANAKQTRTLDFSDSSQVKVAPRTESRLVHASTERVVLDLYKGKLNVFVAPKRDNRWTVRAGAYKVDVLGTKFNVDWSPGDTNLSVSVQKGRVAVRGPGIDSSGIFLSAGSILRANEKDRSLSVHPVADDKTALKTSTDAFNAGSCEIDPDECKEKGQHSPVGPSAGSAYPGHAHDRLSDWKQLARDKQYTAAMEVARKIGLPQLLNRLPANDLWLLATTARYAGSTDAATVLFTTHRRRFPQNMKSKTAAYMLAVIALDHQNNSTAALAWLSTYLSEAPDGALHEEALGRMMKLTTQMGRQRDARHYARTYFRQYPNGLFLAQAKSILQD